MKIAFLSGVNFGKSLLKELLQKGWNIDLLFTYKSEKQKFYSDYVSFDELSIQYGIPHYKVDNINDKTNIDIIMKSKPDLLLVMGWSQLLRSEIINIPGMKIIGSHPTELPKFRGRAPIPWSILKNLKESALTFFLIKDGVDNGPIVNQKKFLISEDDDARIIYDKIIQLGKKMIIETLIQFKTNNLIEIPQDETQFIENWLKRTPEDGKISWNFPAIDIHRLIRASTHPYPGAFTFFKGEKLIIWTAQLLLNSQNSPGKILEIFPKVKIGTGNGVLILDDISYLKQQHIFATEVFQKSDIGMILE